MLLSSLFSGHGRQRGGDVRRQKARLRLDELEGRWQPAQFQWHPAAFGDRVWSDGRNWDVQDPRDGSYGAQNPLTAVAPGPNDTAVFSHAHPTKCIVDAPVTVHAVSVETAYASSIVLAAPLTISKSALGTGNSWLFFADPDSILRAPRVGEALPDGVVFPGGLGMVLLEDQTSFRWLGGELDHVFVGIDSGAIGTVRDVGRTGRLMTRSQIGVDGTLDWISGSVLVSNAGEEVASGVTVGPNGTFNIKAAGAYWGSTTPSEFVVDNAGQVVVDAGGVNTIRGDYLNTGTTLVKRGTFKITGRAESLSGTVELRDRASVDVTQAADPSLYILRGSLIGDGTVMGNLSLNRANSGVWAGGTVAPGWSGEVFRPGTLNVTGDFFMWSGGCAVSLGCNETGAVRKLEIAGKAEIRGYLIVGWHNDYRPGDGTTISFMTCSSRVGFWDVWYTSGPEWQIGTRGYLVYFDLTTGVVGGVYSEEW